MVFDVCSYKKLTYFFLLSLGVMPSESDALLFPITHDEIPKQIAIKMMTTNLLHIYIVFYRNLQFMMR